MSQRPKYAVVPHEFLEFVKNAPVSSGVCCCGDDMDRHANDHSPVDQWDYSLQQWMKDIEAAAPSPKIVLTDEEIEAALDAAKVPEYPGCESIDIQFARAIERAVLTHLTEPK